MSKKHFNQSRSQFAEELQHVLPNNGIDEHDPGQAMYIKIEPVDDNNYDEQMNTIPPRTVILNENDVNRLEIEAEIGLVSQLEFIKTEIDVDEMTVQAFRNEMMRIATEDHQTKNDVEKAGSEDKMKKDTKMKKKKEKEAKMKKKKKSVKLKKDKGKNGSNSKDLEPVNIIKNGRKMVKCPLCVFTTTTRNRSYLKQHLRCHTGEMPFPCLYCPRRFNANSSLYQHIKKHHPSKKTYRCLLCRMIFYKKDEFRSHELKCVKRRTFECHICRFKMKRLYMHKVKEHMRRNHTGERLFRCNQCFEMFLTRASLSGHMQQHPDVLPFECSICKRRFAEKQQWKKHEEGCTTRRRLECHLCQYSYARLTMEGLRMHMRKHTGEKPFQCHLCQKYFPRTEALAQHIQRHRDLFTLKCSRCHRRFLNVSDLENHEQKCRKRRYECHLCRFTRFGLSFSKFRRHVMNTHLGEKCIKCTACDGSFSSPELLTRHVRQRHPPLLTMICLICNRRFADKSARDAHWNKCMKRRIECYICGLSLKTMKRLKVHMVNKHTSEKKHQCKICSRLFQRSINLKIHMNSHTKIGLVKCLYCSKTFSHIKYKKKHEFRCKKVYQCYLCRKEFPSFAILHGTHMRSHLGTKPYDCSHCPKSFSSIRCHNLHVIKDHLHVYKFQCNECHQTIITNQDVQKHRACMKPIRRSVGVIYFKCSLCGLGLPRIPELRHHILAAKCTNHPKKQR